MRRVPLAFWLLTIAVDASALGICLEDSPYGINGTWNCGTPPVLVPNSYVGYSIDGTPCTVWTFPQSKRGPVPPYVWEISASSTDPSAHTGPLPIGSASLWLWLSADLFWPDPGATSAEFNLASDHANLQLLSVTTYNGITNAGPGPETFQLTFPGCTIGPILVAQLHMQYLGPVAVEGDSWAGVKSLYR